MTIVRKEYDSHYVRLKAVDQGVVTAVVSVFGNVDLVGDRVLPGAFTASLDRWRKSGERIPVVWSHEWLDPMSHIGYVTEAKELSDGLLVTTQFDVTGNPRAAYIFRLLKERRVTNWSFSYDIVSERTAPDGAHELLAVDLIEVGPALRGANPETYTVSAKTTTTSTAPVYVNWHTTAVDHEAADLKRREALKGSPAYWSRKIDEAADGTRPTVTEEDRRAADEFILAEKLAAIQRALDQDEQKRWEQQMATLALNQVPVRVDARMRPVTS
ncbi:MAG TPA: HK97 family phage prohead protease [Actinomycetota bacterium]|nr:HK97 family phage prohead protease [Actinomycetota bacterium]